MSLIRFKLKIKVESHLVTKNLKVVSKRLLHIDNHFTQDRAGFKNVLEFISVAIAPVNTTAIGYLGF